MKRWLAFLCTLMMLLQPVGHVHAADITTTSDLPQCEQCGGDAQFTQWADAEGGHVKACPHGVTDPDSFVAHAFEWHSNESEHWYVCTIGGEEDPGYRDAHGGSDYCTAPEHICVFCRTEYTPKELAHGNIVWDTDSTSHWQICEACGAVVSEKTDHYESCTNPGYCATCGIEYTAEWLNHNWSGTYQNNDAEHWMICPDCNEEVNRGPHYADCDALGKCAVCGVAYTGDISHTITDENYYHSETEHWQVCSACNEKVFIASHWEACSNPGHCAVCGADYTDKELAHRQDGIFYFDETEHWWVCPDCGNVWNRSIHYEECDNPGKCAVCGADYVDESISHVGSYVQEHNDTEHWNVCSACGEEIPGSRKKHTGNEECSKSVHECVTCGAEYVPAKLKHNYTDLESTLTYNDEGHWYECPDCGAMLTSNGGINPHVAKCDDLTHCSCGAELDPNKTYYVEHDYDSNPTYGHNSMTHWRICSVCGQEEDRFSHIAHCSSPNKCEECGAEGVVIEVYHNGGFTDQYEYDQTSHWRFCSICGLKETSAHESACDDPSTCIDCGAKNIQAEYVEHYFPADASYSYNATHHWMACSKCGEAIYEPEEHFDACFSRDGICDECGQPFTSGAYQHWNDHDMLLADAEKHWFICNSCNEVMEEEEHYMLCTLQESGVCFMCGEPCTRVEHVELSEIKSDAENHWFECEDCHEKVQLEAHTPSKDNPAKCGVCGAKLVTAHTHAWVTTETAATCTKDGSIVKSCACGESTTQVIPAIGHDWAEPVVTAATCTKEGSSSSVCKNCDELSVSAIPAPGHKWTVTDRLAPTCTADGYRVSTCSVCAAETTATLAATGHNYDVVVYVSQGNGTHGTNCLNGCGTKKTEKCALITTTIGNMLCSACPVCGYAEYTMQSANSELIDSDVAAEIEIVRIENAVIVPVVAEEAPLPADTELVVHLTVPAVPIELDSEVQGKVEKLFAVNLISEGVSIQPSGKVRLSIPYEETEELDVNVMKLMLLCEDGTLMEIEYELIDGMIVFDTDMVGVFALMRADELL